MGLKYHIAMLWVEGPLSYVEQLCAKSFLDAGHEVTLYHYGPIDRVPKGINVEHGDAILARSDFIKHDRTGSLALFSDVFRYHLLNKLDLTIWADMDAYCMRPFETPTGHFFGWESPSHINGGVLGLPKDSEALAGLLAMTEDEYGIPFWFDDAVKAEYRTKAQASSPVHVSEMPWAVWGPHAVTAYLRKTGEDKYAFPCEVLYPVPFMHRRRLVRKRRRPLAEACITSNTTSIHLYGRRMRSFLAGRPGGIPDKGGLLDHLLQKHHIDPHEAPIS